MYSSKNRNFIYEKEGILYCQRSAKLWETPCRHVIGECFLTPVNISHFYLFSMNMKHNFTWLFRNRTKINHDKLPFGSNIKFYSLHKVKQMMGNVSNRKVYVPICTRIEYGQCVAWCWIKETSIIRNGANLFCLGLYRVVSLIQYQRCLCCFVLCLYDCWERLTWRIALEHNCELSITIVKCEESYWDTEKEQVFFMRED